MTKSFYTMGLVPTKNVKKLVLKTSNRQGLSKSIIGMFLIIEIGQAYNVAGGFLSVRDS